LTPAAKRSAVLWERKIGLQAKHRQLVQGLGVMLVFGGLHGGMGVSPMLAIFDYGRR